jgi:hypothetical protein
MPPRRIAFGKSQNLMRQPPKGSLEGNAARFLRKKDQNWLHNAEKTISVSATTCLLPIKTSEHGYEIPPAT